MKFRIKQERTYTTWLTIEADNYDEAEAKYLEMVYNGSAYHEELEQMNVGDENYEIYKSREEETQTKG